MRQRALDDGQPPKRRYGPRVGGERAGYACYRRSHRPAGVAGRTRRPLVRPPEALLRSCRLLVSKEINERLRRSTGSGALQPRVESGTPPKRKVTRSKDCKKADGAEAIKERIGQHAARHGQRQARRLNPKRPALFRQQAGDE